VLRPIIQGVVNPIAGALTGGGLGLPGTASAAGGLGNAAGSVNGIISSITGGLTSSIAGLVSGAGQLFGSTALSTFATGMQGNALAAGLAGPTTAGASGILGAGASFASAVPYIAGALALFSAKDALFGRKLKDTSITGTLGGEAGFSGATEQFFKGGLFRSNKTETKALDAEVSGPLAASVQAIKKTVSDYAGALNLPVDQIAGFTQAIKFSTKDLSRCRPSCRRRWPASVTRSPAPSPTRWRRSRPRARRPARPWPAWPAPSLASTHCSSSWACRCSASDWPAPTLPASSPRSSAAWRA